MKKFVSIFIIFLFTISLISYFIEDSFLKIGTFTSYLMPSFTHFLGTDALGRDYFIMLLAGFRNTVFYGIYGTILTLLVALFFSILASLSKKSFYSYAIKHFAEAVDSLPFLPIAITLASLISFKMEESNKILITITIIALIGWTRTMLFLYAVFINIDEKPLFKTLRAIGLSKKNRLKYYFLYIGKLLALQFSLLSARCIGNESVLSFLGLGVSDPSFSLGSLLNNSSRYIDFTKMSFQWLSVALVLVMLIFMLHSLSNNSSDNNINRENKTIKDNYDL